jgi:hypothetical protein
MNCLAIFVVALLVATVASTSVHQLSLGSQKISKPQSQLRTDPCVGNGYPITAHGGNIMPFVNIYVVWYGNWAGNTATTIIPTFLAGVGASTWYGSDIGYYGADGKYLTQNVTLIASTTDSYTYGSNLTQLATANVVYNQILLGHLPNDPVNGLYFVFTSPDVLAVGFCTSFCGYHSAFNNGVSNYHYSFVGNPATQCLTGCSAQTVSPNGNAGADAMINIIGHELSEAATDPLLTSWYDAIGCENGDKCEWQFANVYSSGTYYYNVVIGANKYLIQELYNNVIQACEESGTTGRATTGLITTGRATTGRATTGQATTGRSTTGRATTGRSTTG